MVVNHWGQRFCVLCAGLLLLVKCGGEQEGYDMVEMMWELLVFIYSRVRDFQAVYFASI